ncbi:multisubstrate pseudouridine synthase 7 [Zalaria obscura]|uniref:Multisubstrate pseudouridine synthase 7 n=1 Tax=Zalaria obscura TaxID=2024903 RepID=A0ACC3S3T5_9PEZI
MGDIEEQPRKKARLAGPEQDAPVEFAAAPANDATPSSDEVETGPSQLEQEIRAGITAYVSNTAGFTGIVKQRYTDFLVNEILPSGQVLHLEQDAVLEKSEEKPKSASAPAPAPAESVEQPAATGAEKPKEENKTTEERKAEAIASISPEDTATLTTIFGEKTTNALIALYGKILARPDRKARDFNLLQSETIADKQARTDAHVAVRRIFAGRIETQTSNDNTITIKAAPPQGKNKQGRPQFGQNAGPKPKGKVGWDELGGQHLHFTLYKENKDTMEALYFMASQMKLHIKNFQFAGTKDRRGVTVQRISAYRVPVDRLKGMNGRLRQARIGGFKYEQTGLELGDLAGNEFVITLRDCTFPSLDDGSKPSLDQVKELVAQAMQDFQTRGYINYYGLQRFGSFSISTDRIGRKMLCGDLAGAVADILSYSPAALAEAQNPTSSSRISSDDKARAEALHLWHTTSKMGAALDKLPRKFQAENAIIRHLGWVNRKTGQQMQKTDWKGALMGIARNLRLMYVHAYQSLVWNRAAGKRLETFGDKVVEGDLVLVSEHQDKTVKVQQEEIDEDGEVIVRPAEEDMATTADDKFERARPLSKEEAESGRYSIFDVVLPLPGFDVVYPPNAVGAFYKDFMASEEGGGLDPYKMRRDWKDISLSGGYRKLMSRPGKVAYEVKPYAREEEQMVQTDLEKLEGRMAGGRDWNGEGSGVEFKGGDVDADADAQEQKEKIAVVLTMQLGSSQYATMALRELTKGGAVSYKPDFSGAR